MAGSGKVAVLATLMFALLLSGSLIEAARPIIAEGSNVATDGTLMVRDPHSRQLTWLWGGWPWWGGCWSWFWGGCGRRYVSVIHDDKRRHSSRKLNTFFRGGYFPGWFGWGGWGGWGWGGWGWGWGRR